MTPSPAITRLLAQARESALEVYRDMHATPENLQALATRVRTAILVQAILGEWRVHGIADATGLVRLGVTAELGNVLIGEPAIKLEFDFSKTALPALVVRNS